MIRRSDAAPATGQVCPGHELTYLYYKALELLSRTVRDVMQPHRRTSSSRNSQTVISRSKAALSDTAAPISAKPRIAPAASR